MYHQSNNISTIETINLRYLNYFNFFLLPFDWRTLGQYLLTIFNYHLPLLGQLGSAESDSEHLVDDFAFRGRSKTKRCHQNQEGPKKSQTTSWRSKVWSPCRGRDGDCSRSSALVLSASGTEPFPSQGFSISWTLRRLSLSTSSSTTRRVWLDVRTDNPSCWPPPLDSCTSAPSCWPV